MDALVQGSSKGSGVTSIFPDVSVYCIIYFTVSALTYAIFSLNLTSIDRPPSRMSETVDLNSDNESNPPRYPPSSRATSSVYSLAVSSPDVIVISDSDDDENEMHQNSLVDLSHVVKREHEEPEEIPQAIKREFLFFFVGLPCLWSTHHRFTLILARDSIPR